MVMELNPGQDWYVVKRTIVYENNTEQKERISYIGPDSSIRTHPQLFDSVIEAGETIIAQECDLAARMNCDIKDYRLQLIQVFTGKVIDCR